MRIAVDVMGSDHGPGVITRGAFAALAKHPGIKLVLCGDEAVIRAAAKEAGADASRFDVVATQSVIGMDEHPVEALRKKQDSSLVTAIGLVAAKKADAIISAGSTGAQVAASTLMLRQLPGVRRAGIVTLMPTKKGHTTVIDVGANVNCKPVHLQQYAVMGSLFSQAILGTQNPRVGLLSVGEETTKGNNLVIESNPLLAAEPGINFVGNCEGHDVFKGTVDVVVCDGFVGNVLLKIAEGMADTLLEMFKGALGTTKAAADPEVRQAMGALKKRIDWQEVGGALLIGVGGVSIICHGRSGETAISSAVGNAVKLLSANLNERITQAFAGVAQAAE